MKKYVRTVAIYLGFALIAGGLLSILLAPVARWNRIMRPYYTEAAHVMADAEWALDQPDSPERSTALGVRAQVVADELDSGIGPVPSCAFIGVVHLQEAMRLIERAYFGMPVEARAILIKVARGHVDAAAEDAFCP